MNQDFKYNILFTLPEEKELYNSFNFDGSCYIIQDKIKLNQIFQKQQTIGNHHSYISISSENNLENILCVLFYFNSKIEYESSIKELEKIINQ